MLNFDMASDSERSVHWSNKSETFGLCNVAQEPTVRFIVRWSGTSGIDAWEAAG